MQFDQAHCCIRPRIKLVWVERALPPSAGFAGAAVNAGRRPFQTAAWPPCDPAAAAATAVAAAATAVSSIIQ
jgi:hypothetical protein